MKSHSLHTVIGFVRRIAIQDLHALNDRALLARFADQHDESAFAELVRRHGPMVMATARRVLRHEQDAEDVFQAAFLVLARRAANIGKTLPAWLHQVTHRLALRVLQVSSRHRTQPLMDVRGDAPAGDAPAMENLALDEELARLPEQYRSVIVLCYLEGHSQDEAARMLATTADAVNSRLKRARKMLRARFTRNGAGFALLLGAAECSHGLAPGLIAQTARLSCEYSVTGACEASVLAIRLAKGAYPMMESMSKFASAFVFVIGLVATGFLLADGGRHDQPPVVANVKVVNEAAATIEPGDKSKKRGCIILWMGGGPSQIDTFDPKPGNVALFKAIDTSVKGIQFCETVPNLAKQAGHLCVIRSLTHREGDHTRGAYLMHTAQTPGGALDYPRIGSVLARELGDGMTTLPRYVAIDSAQFGAGFLGEKNAPVRVGVKMLLQPAAADPIPKLPDAAAFELVDKENANAMRTNVAKAFDLAGEKIATRDAYGRSRFGNSCLVARRLREVGVPVVEVTLNGWDTHGNAAAATQQVAGQVDVAFSALIKDLEERKLLSETLIVWMGEFGRTPRVNQSLGRDHYPRAFSVVLAGAGVKGGQAIGKTSNDGLQVEERPVTPPELHATIYQALGIDPAKKYRVPNVGDVHILDKGTKAVKEALR